MRSEIEVEDGLQVICLPDGRIAVVVVAILTLDAAAKQARSLAIMAAQPAQAPAMPRPPSAPTASGPAGGPRQSSKAGLPGDGLEAATVAAGIAGVESDPR